jgi:hypothetical protein
MLYVVHNMSQAQRRELMEKVWRESVANFEASRESAANGAQFACHYCGFTSPGPKPPRICPKCSGSAWEREATPAKLRALWREDLAAQRLLIVSRIKNRATHHALRRRVRRTVRRHPRS